jgi:hypothetical protein
MRRELHAALVQWNSARADDADENALNECFLEE